MTSIDDSLTLVTPVLTGTYLRHLDNLSTGASTLHAASITSVPRGIPT
jgi:hypothetical protein